VVFTAQTCVQGVRDGALLLRNVFSDAVAERPLVDLLVDWNGCRSEDAMLQSAGRPQGVGLHAIGDCLAPRNVETAMAEAWQLASEL
jgi:hypothetical protein